MAVSALRRFSSRWNKTPVTLVLEQVEVLVKYAKPAE